ncbi:MAG: hypothetical protein JO001_21815 [Alphaproteobacteria bacterium]|nr:hypothetical protein [Alphaproteobacteria bacterium]
MPPSHLLRHVFETCATYLDAKHRLATTPMALPAFFILAGTRPGEGCVIERTEDAAIIREMPAAIANHWVGLPQGGRPRGHNSDERHRRMEDAVNNESAEWLAAPVLNRDTRIIATINLSQSQMMLQGWEASGPATAELRLDLASGPEFTLN